MEREDISCLYECSPAGGGSPKTLYLSKIPGSPTPSEQIKKNRIVCINSYSPLENAVALLIVQLLSVSPASVLFRDFPRAKQRRLKTRSRVVNTTPGSEVFFFFQAFAQATGCYQIGNHIPVESRSENQPFMNQKGWIFESQPNQLGAGEHKLTL